MVQSLPTFSALPSVSGDPHSAPCSRNVQIVGELGLESIGEIGKDNIIDNIAGFILEEGTGVLLPHTRENLLGRDEVFPHPHPQ